MLEGRWTTLDLEGTTLAIGGTSAPWGPAFAASDVPAADFRILLSHSPDLFYKAQRWGIDLMLSGHNHGGPDPAAACRPRLHAQPLFAPVRPRVLPPERDAALRQRGGGRQAPGSVRLPAGSQPVGAARRDP